MGVMDTVVLARHGQTEWNVIGRRQGQLDSPLTERGRHHAESLSERVRSLSVDSIFTSPLGRAAATADACGRRLGLPVIAVAELSEVHHGRMAGMTNDEIEQRFPGALIRRASDPYEWRFPGGESYRDADARASTALSHIRRAGCARPLVVSHEMIGRMLQRQLTGVDPSVALGWSQPNEVIVSVDASLGTRTELHA